MLRKIIVYTLVFVFAGMPIYACRLEGVDIQKLYMNENVDTGTMFYTTVATPPMERIEKGGKVTYKADSPQQYWSSGKEYTGTESDVSQGSAICTYRAGSYVFSLDGAITSPPKEFQCPNLSDLQMVKDLAEPATELHTKWGVFKASKDNNLKAYLSSKNPPRITGKYGQITSHFSHACEFRFTRQWKNYALKVKGTSH